MKPDTSILGQVVAEHTPGAIAQGPQEGRSMQQAIPFLRVGDLMATDLFTIQATDSLHQARLLMSREHIRHLPVVDQEGAFVGLLSQRDVLASTVSVLAEMDGDDLASLESAIPVGEVMTTHVQAISADADLREAAEYLLEHKIGCLPVVMDHQLAGILTEADFLRLFLRLLDMVEQ
jgi:CBS domain-containing membrane protein